MIRYFIVLCLCFHNLTLDSYTFASDTLKISVDGSQNWRDLKKRAKSLLKYNNINLNDRIFFIDENKNVHSVFYKGHFHFVVDRSMKQIKDLYTKRDLELIYGDDTVTLDIGCGKKCQFVNEVRSKNGKIYGIDLALSVESTQKSFLLKDDITDTKIPAQKFNLFFASYFFTNEKISFNKHFFVSSLKEIVRIAKDDSILLISPVNEKYIRDYIKAIDSIDSAKIVSKRKLKKLGNNFYRLRVSIN